VVVRLLLDGHGARGLDEDATRALEALGGHVATFRPLSIGWLSQANQRNHRRAIVMDGETAFTGGAGVADEWLGDAESPDRWRDDLIRVSGSMARSVQSAFCDLWVRATGEVLAGSDVFPPDPREEPGGERVALHVSVVGAPSSDHTPMRSLFWASFRAAQTRIWITNPYVVPAESIVSVLGDRARAGVDVRILTAGDHSDIAVVRWAGRHNYEALLAAGVRVYEYQPTLIHSKNIVIDGVWSLVGSANLDLRSTQLNEEIVLAIHDVSFATELEEVFRNDLARAREIDPDEWARRGAYARIREKLGFLLQEQL
jgi:cardiolipin synthase